MAEHQLLSGSYLYGWEICSPGQFVEFAYADSGQLRRLFDGQEYLVLHVFTPPLDTQNRQGLSVPGNQS